ncbi:MAG: hydrogenase maturation protease [Actinobacteria bacterium]|nr:hydrogenase maturation protease [Actinomycetota bacterium]
MPGLEQTDALQTRRRKTATLPQHRTLLIGMGNPILCDDAIGVRLAGDLGRRLRTDFGVDVMDECSVGGLNLLDVVAGYDRLIILDSIKTAGGVPGTWYRFTARSLRETMNLNNVHDLNFATTLELGRRMGLRVPHDDDIHIFAVEVDDNITFSEQMSSVLEEAYPDLALEIEGEVAALLEDATCAKTKEATGTWR